MSHKIGFTQWYVCVVWFGLVRCGAVVFSIKFIGNINKIDTVSHIVDIVNAVAVAAATATATVIATAFKVYD